MSYENHIWSLTVEAEEQSCLEDRIKLLKQAINIADAHNDIDRGYNLRIMLIGAEQLTNHSCESVPAFTWILEVYDNNPDLFSAEDLLSIYRWLAYNCLNNLEITIGQADNILEDFRRRSLSEGYSEREYYNIKLNQSLFRGDKISARKYLELRDSCPEDEMTTEGFDLLLRIYVEIAEEDFDTAIFHTNQFVAKQPVHQINKSAVYSGFIYHSLMTGYKALADEYFEKAISAFSGQDMYPYHIYEMSLLMYYMSKYRKDTAWEYFSRFVKWELEADDIYRFHFAASVLPLFSSGGICEIEGVGSGQPYYNEEHTYELTDLFNYYKGLALNLAHRFDVRNNTTDFKETVDKVLEYIK